MQTESTDNVNRRGTVNYQQRRALNEEPSTCGQVLDLPSCQLQWLFERLFKRVSCKTVPELLKNFFGLFEGILRVVWLSFLRVFKGRLKGYLFEDSLKSYLRAIFKLIGLLLSCFKGI